MTRTPDEYVRVDEKVRCCNSLHRIVLTSQGRLRLLDHDEDTDDGMEMLRVLNPGLRCRCHEVAWWWRWIAQERSRPDEPDLPRWLMAERRYNSVKNEGRWNEEYSSKLRKLSEEYALRQIPKGLRPWAEIALKLHRNREFNSRWAKPKTPRPAKCTEDLRQWEDALSSEGALDLLLKQLGYGDGAFTSRAHEILWQDLLTRAKVGLNREPEGSHSKFRSSSKYQRWVRELSPDKKGWDEKIKPSQACMLSLFQERIQNRTGSRHVHWKINPVEGYASARRWLANVAGRPFASLGKGMEVRIGMKGVFILDAPPTPIPQEGNVFLPVVVHYGKGDASCPKWALAWRENGQWDLNPLGENWNDRTDANGWHDWL